MPLTDPVPYHVSIKESVFPFRKFRGVDIVLGPEMRSTGEVMGISDAFSIAFAKSQIAAGVVLPEEGTIFLSVTNAHKTIAVGLARRLTTLGYTLCATEGTAKALEEAHIAVTRLKKLSEGHPNLLDRIIDGKVQLVLNTPSGKGPRTDEGRIRAAAVQYGVPCITTISGRRSRRQSHGSNANSTDDRHVANKSGLESRWHLSHRSPQLEDRPNLRHRMN